MKNSIEKWETIFFMSASIFVGVLLLEAVILTLTSQFKLPFVYLSLIPAFVVAMLFSIQLKRDVKFFPTITIPCVLVFILISLLLIFYPHDSFGGADQSVYSNLASHLVNTFSIKLPSYLNNLTDNYVEKVQTWPKGYPIWLGIQQILFGTLWMLRSNIIIIILGLASFFLVSVYFVGNKLGLIATALFSSSMPFLWFSRETMSENLSFFLLWSIILFLFLCLKTKNHIYLIPVFICSWLFGLTRYEGFLLQFVLLFVLFLLLFLNKVKFKMILMTMVIYILVLISNIYIANDIFLPSFFKNNVPQVSESIKRDISSVITAKLVENNNYPTFSVKSEILSSKLLSSKYPDFIFQMMAKYNFILVILSIFLMAAHFLIRFKKLDKTKKFFFLILILLLPEYYKLISPNVTLSQPWLYRRYMYALLPFGYICFIMLLDNFKNKKILIILSCCLLIINIILSNPILFLRNNWTLVNKLREITQNISPSDFIIINESPLRDYSPMSFLVINMGIRSAASSILWTRDFAPENKIFGGVAYRKIFLLSAKDQQVHSYVAIVSSKSLNTPIYSSFEIASRKSVDLEYIQLVDSCRLYVLGSEEGLVNPYNIGALPFSSVEKYCSQPKNEIVKHKEKLYLYELTYGAQKN